jgi:hypothetical protein
MLHFGARMDTRCWRPIKGNHLFPVKALAPFAGRDEQRPA